MFKLHKPILFNKIKQTYSLFCFISSVDLWHFCCTIISMKKLLLKFLNPLAESVGEHFYHYEVMNGLILLFNI